MNRLFEIILRVSGQGQAKQAFAEVAAAQKQVGDSAKDASKDTKALSDDVKGAGEAAAGAAVKTGQFVDAAGRLRNADGSFAKMKDDADAAGGAIGGLTQKTQALGLSMQKVRQGGMYLAAFGVGAVMLSNKLIKVSADADNARQRLIGLLDAQHRTGDLGSFEGSIGDVAGRAHLTSVAPIRQAAVTLASDEVKTPDIAPLLEASVRNAETLKKPLAAVSEAFAKAYTEGSLTRLKRINILFSEQEEASVKAAYGVSRAAGQVEFMRVVMAATARDTAALGSGLTDLQKRANDNARSFESSAIAIGRGSQLADVQVKNLGAHILNLAGANDSVASSIGWLTTIGGYLASGAGAIVTFGAQYMLFTQGLRANKAAADAAAASQAALAAAEEEAALAAEEEAVALEAEAAAAGGLTLASAGAALGFAGIGVAIAVAGAAAVYWLGQMAFGLDKNKGFVDSLKQGWAAFMDEFTGDNGAERMETQRQVAGEVAKIDQAKSEAVLKGKSQEQADKDALEQKRQLYLKFANEQLKTGDKASMADNQQKAADIARQQQASLPVAAPVAPAAPVIPTASAPIADASGMIDIDPLTSQIRSLEDQKRAAKGKQNAAVRDQLTTQIIELRRQEQDARKGNSAVKAAQRQRDRQQKVEDKDALLVSKAKNEIAQENRIASLQDALEKAQDDKDAAKVKSLTLQIEDAKAERKFADDMAAAAEQSGKHREALEQVAHLRLDADMKRAEITAEKAAHAVSKSAAGKKGLSAIQSFALYNSMNSGRFGGGGLTNALNPNGSGGAGNRFADPTSASGYSEMAWNKLLGYQGDGEPLGSIRSPQVGGGMTLGIPGAGDFTGADNRRAQNKVYTAKLKSIRQGARDKTTIRFEPLEVEQRSYNDAVVD